MTLSDIVKRKRIFRNRAVNRWMLKHGVADLALRQAVEEMARGLVDADLGGGILKKRIPVPGRGKRGGARFLRASNLNDRWFFLMAYAKSARSNFSHDELLALRAFARDLLNAQESLLAALLQTGEMMEVSDEA